MEDTNVWYNLDSGKHRLNAFSNKSTNKDDGFPTCYHIGKGMLEVW